MEQNTHIKRAGKIIQSFICGAFLWEYQDTQGKAPAIHMMKIVTKSLRPAVTISSIPDGSGGGSVLIVNEFTGKTAKHEYTHSLREFFLQICRAATGDNSLDYHASNVWAKL